jgi:hypothetical protein
MLAEAPRTGQGLKRLLYIRNQTPSTSDSVKPEAVRKAALATGYDAASTQRPAAPPSGDQETALQEDALRKVGVERIFIEKASGVKEDRPELAKMLDMARADDVIVVWRLDR